MGGRRRGLRPGPAAARRAGPPRPGLRPGGGQEPPGHHCDRARPAAELAKRLPARAWQRISAGPGAKGPRWYDRALIEVADPAVTNGGGPHWLLIRRRISDGEYAFYRAHAPGPVPLAQLVKVAGSRWKVEDGFAGGKELAALDEHQVRSWTSWHRWTILALLAHASLSVLAQPSR